MSIDMYVGSSQAQASSVNTMCQKQIQGYQELQQAINQFVMSSGELQGKTYDSAKQYFSAVLQPLAKGGMLLSEAVAEACQKFPDDYQSQVDSADLKSSELEEQIQQYQQGIDTANAIIQALSANPEMGVLMKSVLRGVKNVKEGQEKAKKKLEKKLRKLQKFHASSPSIFSEIATLEAAINTGAAQAGTCWNASAGTFSVPKQEEMAWAANVNTLWEKKEAAKNEKIEVKKVTIPGKVNGDGYYYQIFVDGVYDKEASEKYNLDRVKKRTIEGLYHLGELSGINDLYRVATGKDWYTGTKDSRIKAAGFTLLDLIGGKILIKGAKALKIGEIFSAGKKVTKVKVTTKAGRTINKGTVIKGKKTGKYKKTSGPDILKPNVGVVQSRVNLAENPTRFSPSKNAGMKHVRDRHYNPSKNAGQFTIPESDLKNILQSKQVVNTTVKQLESGGFERVIDIGKNVGTVKPSLGGQPTTWIKVITDKAGNIITTYPIPKP